MSDLLSVLWWVIEIEALERTRNDYDKVAELYDDLVRRKIDEVTDALSTAMINAFADPFRAGASAGAVVDAGLGPGLWTDHLDGASPGDAAASRSGESDGVVVIDRDTVIVIDQVAVIPSDSASASASNNAFEPKALRSPMEGAIDGLRLSVFQAHPVAAVSAESIAERADQSSRGIDVGQLHVVEVSP